MSRDYSRGDLPDYTGSDLRETSGHWTRRSLACLPRISHGRAGTPDRSWFLRLDCQSTEYVRDRCAVSSLIFSFNGSSSVSLFDSVWSPQKQYTSRVLFGAQ